MSGLATHQFDLSVFEAVGRNRVRMNGPTVLACNVNIHEGMPMLSFETWGELHYYMVTAWDNKVEIKVLDPDAITHTSTMLPRNQSELLEALDTMCADFEEWYDARLAS